MGLQARYRASTLAKSATGSERELGKLKQKWTRCASERFEQRDQGNWIVLEACRRDETLKGGRCPGNGLVGTLLP